MGAGREGIDAFALNILAIDSNIVRKASTGIDCSLPNTVWTRVAGDNSRTLLADAMRSLERPACMPSSKTSKAFGVIARSLRSAWTLTAGSESDGLSVARARETASPSLSIFATRSDDHSMSFRSFNRLPLPIVASAIRYAIYSTVIMR